MGFIDKFKKGFKDGLINRENNKKLDIEKNNYYKRDLKVDITKNIKN